MKLFATIGSFVLAGSLFAGYTFTEADGIKEEPKVKEVEKSLSGNNVKEKKVIDPREWKDITEIPDDIIADFDTNVKTFISNKNGIFQDVYVKDELFGESYFYYLEAMAMRTALEFVKVQGAYLERDFDNLQLLAAIIEEEQIKRSDHLSLEYLKETYGSNKRGAVNEWKEPTKRMLMAIDYTKKLLNDIDVAINKNGEGETFGVSYQLEGERAKELQNFISEK